MIINNLEEMKAEITKVLVSEGFIEFCKKCPVPVRCCKHIVPNCQYVINKCDCKEKKRFECYFYICPVLDEKNKAVSNWLQRVRCSMSWPNELKFPFEMEEF